MRIQPEETQVLDSLGDIYDALGGSKGPEAQMVAGHGFRQEEIERILAAPLRTIAQRPPSYNFFDDPSVYLDELAARAWRLPHQVQDVQRSMYAILDHVDNENVPIADILAMGQNVLAAVGRVGATGAGALDRQLRAATKFGIPAYPQPEVMAYTHDSLEAVPALLTYIERSNWTGKIIGGVSMRHLLGADDEMLRHIDEYAAPGRQTADVFGYERRFMLSKIMYPYIAQRYHGHEHTAEDCIADYASVIEQAIETGPEFGIVAQHPDREALQGTLSARVADMADYAETDAEKGACTQVRNAMRRISDDTNVSIGAMILLGTKAHEALPGIGPKISSRFRDCVARATDVVLPELTSPELAAYAADTLEDVPAHAIYIDKRRGIVLRTYPGTMKSFPAQLKSNRRWESDATKMERDYFRGYRRRFMLSKLIYQELGV